MERAGADGGPRERSPSRAGSSRSSASPRRTSPPGSAARRPTAPEEFPAYDEDIETELPLPAAAPTSGAGGRSEARPTASRRLEEVRRVPWNGYVVASLFAGGGGSSTGYRMAGYRVAYANDVVEEARDTYRANCAAYTTVDGTDVREVRGAAILDAVEAVTGAPRARRPRRLAALPGVLDGRAARQDLGARGRARRRHARSARDDLFFEYARLLDELAPLGLRRRERRRPRARRRPRLLQAHPRGAQGARLPGRGAAPRRPVARRPADAPAR